MFRYRIILLQLIIAIALVSSLYAQEPVLEQTPQPVIMAEPNVEVEAHFDRTEVLLGGHVTYTVSFRWIHDGTRYRITPPHIDPAGYDVINVATSSETMRDNDVVYKVRNYDYDLQAVKPGDQMVDALTVNYYVEGNPDPYFVSLPALSIEVIEVKEPLFKDVRLIMGAAGAVLITVVVIIVIGRRKKKKRQSGEVSPQEKLLKDIEAMQDIFDRGEYNKVVDALDACAQTFLFSVLGIDKHVPLKADALSAFEAFRALHEKHRATIIKIFNRAEEARYSGMSYERHEVRSLLDEFKNVVETMDT